MRFESVLVVLTGAKKCQSTHMPHRERILGLDVARSIAILSVIAAHTTGLRFGVFRGSTIFHGIRIPSRGISA